MTPNKAWSGKKSNLDRIHTLSFMAVGFVPTILRDDKLSLNAKLVCFFDEQLPLCSSWIHEQVVVCSA